MSPKHLSLNFLSVTLVAVVHAQNVRVDSVKDLFAQLGSNKTIELAEGVYNISDIADTPIHPNVAWENNHDGSEPVISDISNLTIKGSKGGGSKIVIQPRYAWVMNFVNCRSVSFTDIAFGHTEAGYCMGGVLSFTDCKDITFTGCSLYGSGTVGTTINNCHDISFKNCDIYECTYGLAYIYGSSNILFHKTGFRKTGEFDLIEIIGCKQVTFSACTFSDNYNGNFMPHLFTVDSNTWTELGTGKNDVKSENILIQKCVFKNNNVQRFANDESKLTLKGNKFSGNKFQVPQ